MKRYRENNATVISVAEVLVNMTSVLPLTCLQFTILGFHICGKVWQGTLVRLNVVFYISKDFISAFLPEKWVTYLEKHAIMFQGTVFVKFI